jgi:hypothetical protein
VTIRPATPRDLELLAQLPALVRRHNANAAEATGVPEVLEPLEAEIVDGWIARLLQRDPRLHMVLAIEGDRLVGAWAMHHADPHTVRMLTMNSTGRLHELREMFRLTVAWAKSRGARQIVGTTFRSPAVFRRAMGTEFMGDLYALRVA